MSRDLITRIESLYTAYNGLAERCCTSISPLEPDQCAGPSIGKVYYAVKQLMAGGSCKTMTESTDAPDPGEIGQCVDGDWLERCEAWINGITCKDAPNPDLPSVCDIDLNSAGGIEGYDQTFSAQEGTIHIEFEAYGVPDQLIISTDTGTLLDTGMMSGHLSRDIAIPIGISSLRIQVIGSSSGTAWTLQVSCVEDDGFPSADCFTGVYDLGSVSFPMNKWADGDYRGSNGYLYWSYENSRWQMGNGYGDGVIYVGPSTKSNPVGFYPGGFMDSYHVTGPC